MLRRSPKPKKSSIRRTQEERSAETRARLIDATIRLLCEQDFNTVGTPAIAKMAGVSRGALQHQFASKEDLLVATVDHISEQIHGQLEFEHLPQLPLADRVTAIFDRYWSVLGGSP